MIMIFGHPKKPQVELLGTPLEADVEAMQAASSESWRLTCDVPSLKHLQIMVSNRNLQTSRGQFFQGMSR